LPCGLGNDKDFASERLKMGFRFRRTFSLLPGIRLNFGATGPSVSVGPKGAKLTFGHTGVRASAGIRGTGMFVSQKLGRSHDVEPDMELPPEVKQLIEEQPKHWEFLLLQHALRSAAEDINRMALAASTYGTDAITFFEWVRTLLEDIQKVAFEWNDLMNRGMPQALGLAGKPADPNLLIEAIDRLILLTRLAVEYEQKAAALARHPLYGGLAKGIGRIGEPFVDAFNDLLGRLDDQLPNFGVTHELNLQLKLNPPTTVESYVHAQDAFHQRFFNEKEKLRYGDVVTERFLVARADKQIGEFSRTAIADNLSAGLFLKDDWFWSADAQAWQPLGALEL
jgi:hypothetical protein